MSWVACGSFTALGLRGIYRRLCARHFSYWSLGLFALMLSFTAAPIWYLADLALDLAFLASLRHLNGIQPLFESYARVIGIGTWAIPFKQWISCGIFLFTWSSLYFCINAMLDLEAERAQVGRAMKLADSARLRALQSQVNPHFLFNALNGVVTLIRNKDDATAIVMVAALGEFLRSMLQKFEQPEITVEEELSFIDQYLRIQRIRFGTRLRSRVDVDPECLNALIPTFILQPLVENAVRHGVLAREDGGSLCVSIRRREGVLVVSVEDDGPGIQEGSKQSHGVGLGNAAERLATLYGELGRLSTGSGPECRGFAVVIQMPFRLSPGVRSTSRVVAATE
jgi:two-component system, LytTR family, sensor kinase